ncbi:O-antigen ligase family protein [Candidatus Saccharibacteria bacterium]|nr:O-antigen ligase family protein [Candidatus Saccharibacteria bacterium]
MLPLVLYFSYYPIIPLGSNETMNFELSLPLIWLVVFDVVGVVVMLQKRLVGKIWRDSGWEKWLWILLPLWVSLSAVWSLNMTRGVLTAGILWLIYLAILLMITVIPAVVEDFARFRRTFLKWFLGSTILVCVWCAVQCVLDVMGVGQNCTLLCDGCTYGMFGFPHPNGFAIEPQFMGNLLLAPVITMIWLMLDDRTRFTSENSVRPLLFCFFITSVTLFLTFSRGAIYAFVVGLTFMTVFMLVRARRGEERKTLFRRSGVVWGVTVLAFLFTLNLQGVFAQVAPTSDTYGDGVAKVLNHLSLGVIDVRGGEEKNGAEVESAEIEVVKMRSGEDDNWVVENSVENLDENRGENGNDLEMREPVFDGYVAESTDTRVRLTGAALEVWSQDFKTMVIGVGIGGAGQALYDNRLASTPKEIVQNEYASLLLEAGVVGVLLLGMTIVLIVRLFIKGVNIDRGKKTEYVVVGGKGVAPLLLVLIVAYGVTLCFFSGLSNALQIYLMPAVLMVIFGEVKNKAR